MSTGKTYDALNRLKTISAGVGSQTVSSYGYSYNSANQRTRVDLADGSYVAYEYDTLGQVTSGKRYWSGGVAATGQQYNYQFDGIGNRLSTTVNGRETGYTPNALNQYANREIASVLDILGNAAPSATVTVNDKAVTRQQGGYFAGEVNVNNSTEPVYAPIRIVGVKAGAGADGKDIVTTSSGNLFVAKTPESFFYDLDGNLTSDGRWNYTWDGENRLIAMEARSEVPAAAKKKLIFSYDYQGRRVEKAVYLWNAATSSYEASAAECARFLYDGWNLIAELNASNAITRSYLWGVDLSNTAQGAGGVGGLLAVTTSGTNAGSYIYAYDGNGNVSDLVNEVGASVAHYEYGPFGESIRVSGAMAGSNPFRFSTKYTDDETGLVYYGYRFYNPSTGRWINKDPIGENGGENLYGMVGNDPVNGIDYRGLIRYTFDKTACTLNVDLKWRVQFTVVDEHENQLWLNAAKSAVEGYFNNLKITCKSKKCCLCPDGVKVKVNLQYVGSGADYTVVVRSTSNHRSSVNRRNNTGDFGVNDPYPSDNYSPDGTRYTQTTVVHETGHMLGADHPGQNSNPPATPNSNADYDADPTSLMGRGMEMRLPNFDTAFCSHINDGQKCGPWSSQ